MTTVQARRVAPETGPELDESGRTSGAGPQAQVSLKWTSPCTES